MCLDDEEVTQNDTPDTTEEGGERAPSEVDSVEQKEEAVEA